MKKFSLVLLAITLMLISAVIIIKVNDITFSENEENSASASKKQVEYKSETITDEAIPVSEGLAKLPEKFQHNIKLPESIPYKVREKYSYVEEVFPKNSTYQFSEYIETDKGFFQIRAVSPPPKVKKPGEGEVKEFKEVIINDGVKGFYQDNGQVQMIKWLDKKANIYYWIVGNKDIEDSKSRLSLNELKVIVNNMNRREP
ncbi:hypothetical protein ACQ0QQ_08390 [Lysinibacillus sphaericus]